MIRRFRFRVRRRMTDEGCKALDESRCFNRRNAPQAVVCKSKIPVGDHVSLLNDVAPRNVGVALFEWIAQLPCRFADHFDAAFDSRLLLLIILVLLPRDAGHKPLQPFAPANDVPHTSCIAVVRPHRCG